MWGFSTLIWFGTLPWVGFLTAQGVMIVVSLFLTLIVLVFSVILCAVMIGELKDEKRTDPGEEQRREQYQAIYKNTALFPVTAMRTSAFKKLMILLLLFIILLASIILIGQMLLASFSGEEEAAAAPLLSFPEWVEQGAISFFSALGNLVDGFFTWIEGVAGKS